MLQGKTGTQLRLKLLHNVRFWACVILTPQMSRKYSLFLFFFPWFGICGSLNAPGSCNVLRERQRALAEYFTGEKNHTPVFCKCASCILKMTPYRDHVKENKNTAFCSKKKRQNLKGQSLLFEDPRPLLHFKTHQNKPAIIKIII